jgi:2'-5' RNA ligase
MRLFTALDLPAESRARLTELQSPEALNARWSPSEQLHITVRFIGEVPREQAEQYEQVLSQIDAPPVECIPYGLDVLPSRRNPSVLVVGLERTDDLMELYRAVSRALERQGLDPESRPYRPHVTLARLNQVSATAVHQFLDVHSDWSLPPFNAHAVHLYESTLTQDGAIHEHRRSVSLRS